MFKCDFCQNASKPGDKLRKQVTKIRNKTYLDESFGVEIVEEKKVCGACYLAASAVEPELVADDLPPEYSGYQADL